jgi:transposase
MSLTKLPEQLDALRLWDGSPIPPGLRRRVLRVYAHHTFLSEQIAAVEAERRAQLPASTDASIDKVRQLMLLKGIGINGAWLLVMEFFGWRQLKNRREVGGLAGFTPTPVSKRRQYTGTRDHQGGQPTRALDDHGVGVELAALSAGQRPECLVP